MNIAPARKITSFDGCPEGAAMLLNVDVPRHPDTTVPSGKDGQALQNPQRPAHMIQREEQKCLVSRPGATIARHNIRQYAG